VTQRKHAALISGLAYLWFCLLLLQAGPLPALDFSILNKGEIIFQEILIQTDLNVNSYYYNFGMQGLEPGARHNIHLNTTEDLVFCSFYLFGISNESYEIENVAIEQNSIVYILPEHYQDQPENYEGLNVPSAVYGAEFLEKPEIFFLDEESPETQFLRDIEVFNYTNSPIFRIYLIRDAGEEIENMLTGDVLLPHDSITLSLPLPPGEEYILRLLSSDDYRFEKRIGSFIENDFLVYYDSDRLREWENIHLLFRNETTEPLSEIFLIDQDTSLRIEVLKSAELQPGEQLDFLLTEDIRLCDIIIRTGSNRKFYILDEDLEATREITIKEQ